MFVALSPQAAVSNLKQDYREGETTLRMQWIWPSESSLSLLTWQSLQQRKVIIMYTNESEYHKWNATLIPSYSYSLEPELNAQCTLHKNTT